MYCGFDLTAHGPLALFYIFWGYQAERDKEELQEFLSKKVGYEKHIISTKRWSLFT